MSDFAQSPDWWQASDGKWYPPQGGTRPPPPSPGYYADPAGPQQTAGGATASLVFGILGFVILPLIGGIAAIVLGFSAKRKIRESGGRLGGDGMATAGIVLGFVGFAIPMLAIVAIIAISFLGTSAQSKFSTVGSELSLLLPLL